MLFLQASNATKTDIASTVSSSIVNITRRYRREDQGPCYKFEEGDPVKKEFYSPGYPEPYPKNIECFKVLEGESILKIFRYPIIILLDI